MTDLAESADGSLLPQETHVLIVGAGPTGLTLAIDLARRGLDFVIVDALPERQNTARAAVIHARTLEVLDEIDLSRRLGDAGLRVPRFTIRDRDTILVDVRFDQLASPYATTIMIPQDETEDIFIARLGELGRKVIRTCRLGALIEKPTHVEAELPGPGDSSSLLRAKYVVGADGSRSTVRELAGIDFLGDTYESSFILADVHMDWPLELTEVVLFFSAAGLMVVAPMTQGRHRIVATVAEAPPEPDLALVQRVIDERGPTAPRPRVNDILWSTRFRIHHRVASKYRSGRILLAGDAAHVHSPAGGQGMNTGVRDAVALSGLLSRVLSGEAEESLLDDYERARRPVADRVLRMTDGLTRLATMSHPVGRQARNILLRALGSTGVFRRRLAVMLAGLDERDHGAPQGLDAAPRASSAADQKREDAA